MGEYIEFALEETPNSEHKFQAKAVTGPHACPLMCETSPIRRRPRQIPVVTYIPAGRGTGGYRGRGGRGGSRRPAPPVENTSK